VEDEVLRIFVDVETSARTSQARSVGKRLAYVAEACCRGSLTNHESSLVRNTLAVLLDTAIAGTFFVNKLLYGVLIRSIRGSRSMTTFRGRPLHGTCCVSQHSMFDVPVD